MSVKCLLLETSDKKRLFTSLGNRKPLLECCRAFGAKLHVVRAEIKRSSLMDLKSMVAALCDKSHKCDKHEFKVIAEAGGEKKPRRRSRG